MAQDFIIDYSDLRRFIFGLSRADKLVMSKCGRHLKKLGEHTQKKMKQYAKSKSTRSTGYLSSRITSKYLSTAAALSAEIFVPNDVKYQFAAEYGISRQYTIAGNPNMAFSIDAWKKARRGMVMVPHRGYFVFAQVQRGRYKGRFFTQRAFQDLKHLYDTQVKDKLPTDIVNAIAFSR